MDYSRRRRSGRSAQANSGKQPLHPCNQVERQPLQETRGSRETSLPLQGDAQSSFKQSISHQADNEKKTVENHGLISKPDSAVRPASNVTSISATALPSQTSGQKLTLIDSELSKRIPFQELPLSGKFNTVVSHSWSTKPDTTRSSPIHFRGTNSTLPNVDSDQQSSCNVLPIGVVVACDHFLRGSSPQSSKVCVACKQPGNPSCLRYAVWNKSFNYWQEIRPFPAFMVPPRANLDLCRHFNPYKRCAKEACTFPHGQVESAMWTMERNGGKLSWLFCFEIVLRQYDLV